MLRLLLESNARRFQYRQGAVVSLVTHAALITAAAVGTHRGPAEIAEAAVSERVSFLVPLNRTTTPPPQQESIQYVREGQQAGSGGVEDRPVLKSAPVAAPIAGSGPEEGTPEEVSEPVDPLAMYDTVATAIEVDSMVARYPDSAAPTYPSKLLELKIEGGAYVQFVVDTTGYADTLSFRVISATHPEFAASVREALPRMRFSPAVLRSKKVRQLVEQPFMFKIVPPTQASAATEAKKP